MKKFLETGIRWFISGIAFSSWIILVVYASNIALNELWNKSEWAPLTLEMWNSLVSHMQELRTDLDTIELIPGPVGEKWDAWAKGNTWATWPQGPIWPAGIWSECAGKQTWDTCWWWKYVWFWLIVYASDESTEMSWNSAMTACNGTKNWKSDWYLPSKIELDMLYNMWGFAGYTYWSRTENGASYAWSQNLVSGAVSNTILKTNSLKVRCVRKA